MLRQRFKVKTTDVEVGKLLLHQSANRERSQGRIRELVKDMDLDALGRFAIWRDGRDLYIVDGQHRKLALEELGMADWVVRCDVYEGLTFMDACDLFLKLNRSRKVAPFDEFDKAEKAGHFVEVETKKIVEGAGLKISAQSGDGHLIAVKAATDVYKLDQGEALARTLRWATEAWGHTAPAVEGHILTGLGQVAFRFNGEIDDEALIKKIGKYAGGPRALIGYAKNQRNVKGGTVGRNVGQAIVDIYNKGRRSGQLTPL